MMLITKGRITGHEGRTPVLYFQHGADLIVVASCGGNDMHPAWYLNRERCPEFRTLRANKLQIQWIINAFARDASAAVGMCASVEATLM